MTRDVGSTVGETENTVDRSIARDFFDAEMYNFQRSRIEYIDTRGREEGSRNDNFEIVIILYAIHVEWGGGEERNDL